MAPSNGNGLSPPTPSTPDQIVSSRTPAKPPNDPNSYRIITLSNGLEACLISSHLGRALPRNASNATPRSFGDNLEDLLCKPFLSPIEKKLNFEDTVNVWMFMENRNPEMLTHLEQRSLDYPSNTTGAPVEGGGGPSGPGPSGDAPVNPDEDEDIDEYRLGRGIPLQNITTVALTVNVGSIDNPENCQGLAHFTEHMVHYGSKKYPGERMVVMNYGVANAYTALHHTTYYFQIPETDGLPDRTINMFADMMGYPNLENSMLEKEVNAVNNEFNLKRHMDVLRRWMLVQHIGMQKGHSLSRFGCGNMDTLGGKVNMKDTMREFHSSNYIAPAMTLTIKGSQPLDDLQKMTTKQFSSLLVVGKRKTFQKMHPNPAGVCTPNVLQEPSKSIIYLQGTGSFKELTLIWELPPTVWMTKPNEKVLDMLQAMLLDTSPGSLDNYLREQKCKKSDGLIFYMTLYPDCSSHATLVQLNFYLTAAGMEKTDEIVNATFAYIDMLKRTCEAKMRRLFLELKVSRRRFYRYGLQAGDRDRAVFCAEALQLSKEDDQLFPNNWENAEFNYRRIVSTLRLFELKNMLMIVTVPRESSLKDMPLVRRNGGTIKRAPFTEAEYAILPRNSRLLKGRPVDFEFEFVPHSPLLDAEINGMKCGGDVPTPAICGHIIQHQFQYRGNPPLFCGRLDGPRIPWITGIHTGHVVNTWYQYVAVVTVDFMCPDMFNMPYCEQLLELWTDYIHMKLVEPSMEMIRTGHQYDVFCSTGKVSITVYGVSSAIDAIINEIILTMFDCPLSDCYFEQALEMFKGIQSWKLGNPASIASQVTKILFQLRSDEPEIPRRRACNEPRDFSKEDLEETIKVFKLLTFAKISLNGNVPLSMFDQVANLLAKQDFFPRCTTSRHFETHNVLRTSPIERVLPPGDKIIRVKSNVMQSYCSVVANYYSLGKLNMRQSSFLRCALLFMQCEAFHFLRTTRQLAYSVHMSPHIPYFQTTFGIEMEFTAKDHTLCEIDSHIDEFMEYYGRYLGTITDADFQLMLKLKAPWLRDVRLSEVVDWYKSWFGVGFAKKDQCRNFRKDLGKLSVQVLGNEAKSCKCSKCSRISDWERFNTEGELFVAVEGSSQGENRTALGAECFVGVDYLTKP